MFVFLNKVKRKLLSGGIYTLGVMSYTIIQWLMLTLITRYLSLDEGGKYAYYFAIFTPIFILFSFGLRNSIATDSELEFSKKNYKSVQLLGFCLFSIVGLSFLILKGWSEVGFLVFLIKAFDLLSELPYGNWVKEKLAYKYGISRILKASIFVIFALLYYVLFGFNRYLFFSYPIVILLVFIFYDLNSSVYGKEDSNGLSTNLSLVKKTLPLALGSLVVSLSSVVPRVFLEHFEGFETVGIYSIAVYIYSMAAIPLTIMMQLILPEIKSIENVKNSFMLKVRYLLFFYILLVSFFVLFFINHFLKYVYNLEYKFTVLQISLLIGFGFFQLFLVYYNSILIGIRDFKSFGGLGFFVLLFNIFLSFFMIETYGLNGALFSATAVSVVSVLSTFTLLNYKTKS